MADNGGEASLVYFLARAKLEPLSSSKAFGLVSIRAFNGLSFRLERALFLASCFRAQARAWVLIQLGISNVLEKRSFFASTSVLLKSTDEAKNENF